MKSLKHFIENGEDAQYVQLLDTCSFIKNAREFETLPKFIALKELTLCNQINFNNEHLYLLSGLTNLEKLDLAIILSNATPYLRDSVNRNYTNLLTLTKLRTCIHSSF